jgi:adenylate cyclase
VNRPWQWISHHSSVLIFAVAVAAVGGMTDAGTNQLELRFSGWVQETRGQQPVPKGIVIVAIDDFSLQQAANTDLSADPLLRSLGQWPWPRSVHATVLDRLIEAGAKTVGFDLVFESPSSHGIQDDKIFAEAIDRHQGRVVLGVQVLASRGPVAGLTLLDISPSLLSSTQSPTRGLLNGDPDLDGVIRERPGDTSSNLRLQLGPSVPNALSVAMLVLNGQSVDLTSQKKIQLSAYGPPRTIPTISIWELLESNAYESLKSSGLLKNAQVLVGPTASVFQDLHPAVFSGSEGMPGVELHATELANRSEGRSLIWIASPPHWNLVMGVVVLIAGLSMARWEQPLPRFGVLAALSLALVISSAGLIAWAGIHLPILGLAISLTATGIITSGEATVRLQWQRLRLRQTLGRYLSPAVAAEVANQPKEADGLLGGRLMNVVILMTDIRGFTAITQEMTSRGEIQTLVQRLNRYFTAVVDVIHTHGGTVDKFIGDAVLAVFGAPIERTSKDNVMDALQTAIEVKQCLATLNQTWKEEGEPPWEQVIVLSYGWVLSGNIGSSRRMDYTVIGDAVNTASRLEAIAKRCNQPIILSQDVAELLPAGIPLKDLGKFNIRGQGFQHAFTLRIEEINNALKNSTKPKESK